VIYEQPIFRQMGDCSINVEFGDESSIPINFQILALDKAIKKNPIRGLIETNPQVRTLGIVFDQRITKVSFLIDYIQDLLVSETQVTSLPSRRLIIPALYDDPWSKDCAEAFGVQNNMEYIAQFNGITIKEVINRHTSSDYWVTGVGFVPGAFMSYAMEPDKRIGAPLYRTPRTWTHERLLNFGGLVSTIYPIRVPGGGQLFGRTPIDIFDPELKNPIFGDTPILSRAGDRHRYVSISREEYEDIRAAVKAGLYEYKVENGIFDCEAYCMWLSKIGQPTQKLDPNADQIWGKGNV